jgi:hypothetical protein
MDVLLKTDILAESVRVYLHFHADMYITFDESKIVLHGVDEHVYTKVLIEKDQCELFNNTYHDRRTYEGKQRLFN